MSILRFEKASVLPLPSSSDQEGLDAWEGFQERPHKPLRLTRSNVCVAKYEAVVERQGLSVGEHLMFCLEH